MNTNKSFSRKAILISMIKKNVLEARLVTGGSYSKMMRFFKIPFSPYKITTKEISGLNSRVLTWLRENENDTRKI